MYLLCKSFTQSVYTRNYAGAASIMRFYAEPISKPNFYVSYAGQKTPDVQSEINVVNINNDKTDSTLIYIQ